MNNSSDLVKSASQFILDKLLNILSFKKGTTTGDAYEKFKVSFESKDVSNEIEYLLKHPKRALLLAAGKDNSCMICPNRESFKRIQKKAVLILKTSREQPLSEDMHQNFLFIELSRDILNQMYVMCKDIFYPMLAQSVYQGDSSELISKELMEKFHNFLAHFYVFLGHINKEILLPIPSDEIFRNVKINDNEKTQICEGAVVMWIELIKHVLKQEPEYDFRNGANPDPMTEIYFWEKKSKNLESILKQIQGEGVLEILKFLEKQKSSYHKFFNEIKKEVSHKSKEASQNYRFLSFVRNDLNEFTTDRPLPELVEYFVPIFHTIRLIWKDNQYYSKPERLIVLIRKICNSLIDRASEFIRTNIFTGITDPEQIAEAIQRLESTREVIAKFMTAYFSYKDNDADGWKITRNVIFYRLDAFNDRVGDILNIARSYNEFIKVSTKSIGGIRGDALEKMLSHIFTECTNAVKDFCKDDLHPLNISSDAFNVKYQHYKETLKELEGRIAAVLTQTFDESDTIIGKFKILENFDSILERPNIVVELEKKYNILLDLYRNELRAVQNLFQSGIELIKKQDPKSPLNKNMPPIAAVLYWTNSLKERIDEPYFRFIAIDKRVTEKEEFREIENLYHSIKKMINDYEGSRKSNWDNASKVNSGDKQKDYILAKKGELLQINFDPQLLQLLKEIKYLKILNLNIPGEAEEVFAKNNIFRKHIAILEGITSQYNNIILSLNEVEKPIVQEKLKKVEAILEPAFKSITWEKTKEIEDFVGKAFNTIGDLASIVDKFKNFVTKIETILKEWKEKRLFSRPPAILAANELNEFFIATFDQERAVMATRAKDFINFQDIQGALKSAVSNLSAFKESDKWKNYLHYINSIIINGLRDVIQENLSYLFQSLDATYDPICKVTLILEERKLIFEPELNANERTERLSIKGMLLGWINSFLNLSTVSRTRVDTGNSGDYMLEILENYGVQEIIYYLYHDINLLIEDCDKVIDSFNNFKIFWEKDFEVSFQDFLKQHVVVPEEESPDIKERNERIKKIFGADGNPILKGVVENTPPKEHFDDKINSLKNMLKTVKKMENDSKIRWVVVDFTSFKSKLEGIIEQWIDEYKRFLSTNSTNKIRNINEFMNRVRKGTSDIPSDNSDNFKFISLLENIRDMENLYPKIIEIIPSIKGELEILKMHSRSDNQDDFLENEEREMESEEHKLLLQTEEISKNIMKLNKDVEEVSQNINELIESESNNFKIVVNSFAKKVENFRSKFLSNVPKKIDSFSEEEISNAYKVLDQYYTELNLLEEEKKKNNNMEMLLKLNVSQNKQISDCFSDLNLYKLMWDYVASIYYTFENWKKIRWDKVQPDEMAERIDVYSAQLKVPLKKEIKTLDAYKSLVKIVANMADIITIIKTLKDKIIKPRHWKHLMEVTGRVLTPESPDFTVDSLIKLEMYNYKSQCENEKLTAVEQEKIETAFDKIEKHWRHESFIMTTFLNKKKYDTPLFDHSRMDGIIENLEKNQVTLMQLSMKKAFLENFEGMDTKINTTFSKLQIVNDVIKNWLKLQKNWEKLEPLFVRAEDVKNKLADEYKKFMDLDMKFKEEMKAAYDYNIMIEVCTEERKVTLTGMAQTIEECERALNQYLDDKKKLFPRFYFLSNDTLLNMLSYGEYPNIINKNVKDCFDGIKAWDMAEVNEEGKSKLVLGMNSAENDERVKFDVPYECTGLVESYLSKFEEKMRKTLKDILYEARSSVKWMTWAHHEKNTYTPRHKWLQPYPAQLALLVTQNIWTDEIEHAFDEMENGTEGAMKEYYDENVKRIFALIERVKGEEMDRDLRTKIITIITVDVHGRDVVESFWAKKMSDCNNFNWKKQLRFKYSLEQQDVSILIADYVTIYSYEYIGNTGRLVITPLTDRCYITLTQALNLILGGAPAGPAGTGKTETTKDLGRNLGLGVIVNNCSEQMDIETTARIFSGLAQTGFWGCFDEFNRISIEVLSVVSTQVKTILDAMKTGVTNFRFEGGEIRLVKTCGFFITMNPGYAGRTELPDNLKALFRSCAMVVPNLENICENMLMSEGFADAKNIARKFITLYTLSRDLLSKQKHYDWGLRAIKSLLRQAGALKRHKLNQGKDEDQIIKNALYDFNKAKIIPDDLVIYRRLLDDLFKEKPSDGKGEKETQDVSKELNDKIEEATEIVKLQKDGSFTLKARQLSEILEVRHCMFILGSPGCGKTSIWRTLFHANKDCYKLEAAYDKLSPKAITGNELFGYFGNNKSWRYGILSAIMKKMCKNDPPYKETMEKKWIILDGDIDPDWIESLNTVMDDNKVLTLNNGDRFPLDEYMRLIFEISNLRNATLATVSRGGVLYVNDNDVGIMPFFEKWIKSRYISTIDNPDPDNETIKSVVQKLFGETFNKIKTDFKDRYVAPMVEMNLVQNVCTLFQYSIEEARPVMKEADEEKKKLIVEGVYFFAFMWGVGGALAERKDMINVIGHTMSKKISIPHTTGGTCFDYFFDPKTCQWTLWSSVLKEFQVSDKTLFQDIIVPNVEVMRLSKITEINCLEEKPVLFIGDAGTGKTAIVKYFLKTTGNLKNNQGYVYKYFPVNFNSFTDSMAFQNILEGQLTVRFGNKFGPLGTTKLIYFLDDLNMPGLDKYGTQSHVELLRQLIDYKEIYDRKNLEEKKVIEDSLFVACQNPKAGSFKIDLRLQRHFTVLGTTEPKPEIVTEIYTFILKNHYKDFRFKNQDSKEADTIPKLVGEIIKASCDLLDRIRKGDKCFTPSATKFHYQWNLREIAKIIEGMLRTKNTYHKDYEGIYKLWLHECNRIFRDRLIFTEDVKSYESASFTIFDQNFSKYASTTKKEDVQEPFIFVPFDENDQIEEGENVLLQKDFKILKEFIEMKLEEYNDNVVSMPLVLFDDAIMHISRIARIISNPSSHALLVGVGGSGKQSLSRIAAYIKSTDVFTPDLTGSGYNKEKLLEDFKNLVKNSCLKSTPIPKVFMINDNHILEEVFLVYINNFLSSSWIEEMYENKTDLDTDLQKVRSAAISEEFMKATDSGSDKIFEYLLYRIKVNIHMILCMSPVGDKLRVRARKFPGILSCTNINWFHEWPVVALEKVAFRKIEEIEQFNGDENTVRKLSQITAELHGSLKAINELYFNQERRYNYTTPKSYLELISFFKMIVERKDSEVEYQAARLENGLEILADISEVIKNLKIEVEIKTVEVEAEKSNTNKILEVLVVENERVNREKEIVSAAAELAAQQSAQAEMETKIAQDSLDEAEPIKEKARKEATNIDPNALNQMKKSSNLSEDGLAVVQLIFFIFFPTEKSAPSDLNQLKNRCLNADANTIKNKLLDKLEHIEWLDAAFLERNQRFLQAPFTDPKRMAAVSGAANNLAGFFQNCVMYKVQYDKVKPLQETAAAAQATADKSRKEKEELEAKLAIVVAEAKKLQEKYDNSKAIMDKVEAEQQILMEKLKMAEKFISLLSGNKTRWTEEVRKLKDFKLRIAGDCLMASSFVSYIGIFNSFFREKLLEKWQSIIVSKDVLITKNIDVVRILITDSQILKFKAEGLPADPFSTENSAIMTSCTRWPLIIDPQMQAIKWLKGMNTKKVSLQYKQREWDIMMGNALSAGEMLIIEDVDQELDPLLTPILAKETIKRDSRQFIKISSEEYEFHPNAKIYFITKVSNPHYKPEVIAQCTLINFIVTEKGLEDQLLAMVVNNEQPELEETVKKCLDDINEFQSELILKEDDVLRNLKEADSNTILENVPLVNRLEETKVRAQFIEENSKKTEDLIKEINIKREQYRRVGIEGAMLFFLVSKLFVVQFMYQYSLESFTYFFLKAINGTEACSNLSERIKNLTENIRLTIYQWVSSGMFEKDKQLFLTMISLRLLSKKAITGEEVQGINRAHIDYLLKCPQKETQSKDKSLDWMDQGMWNSLNFLSDLEGFQDFAVKMEKEQSTKFKEWFNEAAPEESNFTLPLEWKKYKKHSFYKILVLRCCRPDRVSVALNEFVKVCLPRGNEFLSARTFSDLVKQAYNDSNPETPIFFILSPGSNPIKELQDLGKSLGKKRYEYGKNFFDVAMGQKADEKAEALLSSCNQEGHWLFLQNIHLMPKWLKKLQDIFKELAKEKGNDEFRVFLSAEPRNEIPVGILEKSIKLTNEPPSGLKENMKIAFETLKKENPNFMDDKRRANVMFALSYFHSVVLERKKFASLGWNRNYPFNLDDLRASDSVIAKYLEQNPGKVPWDDLRYIVGEIMYGGHIVDDWDRRLSNAYLEYLLVDKINEDLELIPYCTNKSLSLKSPANSQFAPEKWSEYIDLTIQNESPALFGLHPNAEMDYRKQQSDALFQNLIDLEPKDSNAGGGASENSEGSLFGQVKAKCEEILSKSENGLFNIDNIKAALTHDKTPFQNVFIQECEQMRNLCELVKRNTNDMKAAIEGQLTMNEQIEALIDNVYAERVPPKWIDDGFATNRKLGGWITSLEARINQYKIFEPEQQIPKIVFINRLFNPLSYLTAIRQVHARKVNAELDKLDIQTIPTRIDLRVEQEFKEKENSGEVPIYGLHLQGARWDDDTNSIEESKPREDYCVMPVVKCKVVNTDDLKLLEKSCYFCPVYKTTKRDVTYVTTAQFRTKLNPAKWIIAGVAVILDVEKTDSITKYPK